VPHKECEGRVGYRLYSLGEIVLIVWRKCKECMYTRLSIKYRRSVMCKACTGPTLSEVLKNLQGN
jgi:hypothetical protein